MRPRPGPIFLLAVACGTTSSVSDGGATPADAGDAAAAGEPVLDEQKVGGPCGPEGECDDGVCANLRRFGFEEPRCVLGMHVCAAIECPAGYLCGGTLISPTTPRCHPGVPQEPDATPPN